MSKRRTKRFMACLLAGVLAAGSITCTAFADYEAPESGMEADDNYITGMNCAASAALLDILGVCLVSSDGGGTGSNALGIFGSDINDVPDPYLYNYNYNVSTYGGGSDYDVDTYSTWTATPYTLFWSSNKSGPQGGASGSTTITINGVTKICNPAFYYEPDILIGSENGYSSELSSYQETYNADYDPTIISHVYSSGTRSDGLGLEYNMFEMCEGFVAIGEAVNEIADETGKYTRYEESAYEIATNYDKYNRGLYYYAQSAFDSGDLVEISYADSISWDSDSETWTVSSGSGRANQYASGIGTNIYDVLNSEDGYTFSDGTVINADSLSEDTSADDDASTDDSSSDDSSSDDSSSDDSSSDDSTGDSDSDSNSDSGSTGGPGDMSGGGSMGGGSMGGGGMSSTSSSGFTLTTDQLIEILTVTEGDTSYPGVVIGSAGSDDVYTTLQDAGISFINSLPSCIYGLTMNAIENGLGLAFYLSFFYYDQNEELNPVSVMGYWIEHFYHVTDTDAMQTVVSNMLSSADLNAAYDGGDELDINEYNETAIEEMIVAGIDYYQDTVEPALDEAGTDSSSIEYWSTLDTTVGIGSDTDSSDDSGDTGEDSGDTGEDSGDTGEDSGDTGEDSTHTHEYTAVVTDPTCTSVGYTTYTCTDNDDSYVSDYVSATGHSYAVTETVAATCTTQGSTTYTCSVCGDSYTVYSSATGHSYAAVRTVDATDTTAGYTIYICTVCGATYTEYTNATGVHEHDYTAVVTDPTCTEAGYTTYTCADGDSTFVSDYISATGHSYAVTETVEATCTTQGSTTYTCANCDDSYTVYTDALGHNYEAVVTEPTATEAGYTTYTCSVCGDTYKADYVAATGGDSETLAAQTITVEKTVTKTFKAKKLASKKKTFTIKATTSGDGKITFTKKSGSKKLSITKAGKVTVKKGTKAGTYKMKVTVKAAKTATYKAATKTITVKVKVK